MGSILSKLFGGGGGGSSHGSSAQQQQQPPPALLPPPTTAASSSQQQHSTPLPRSTSSASSKHQPATPALASGQQQAVLTPAPINILEVEVDEEAFREAASPPIYTSTLKAQIDPSPPHPLELSQHVAIGQKTSISSQHLVTHLVDVPNGSCAQQNVVVAPIASLDSEDYDLGQEREEAVIKIQAGVRGYLVRKQMVHGKLAPAKSISLDESVLSSVQQQPEHILPPPERFDSSSGSSKPVSIQSKHRVETPIPGSPFAQDDTDYSILDALDPTEQEVQEPSTEVLPLIANTEELEIFRKINEINQLLASKDDDKFIAAIPPASNSLQQETTATLSMNNSAVSSSSIANALSELDQTIHEQESLMNTLHPEESVESTKQEDEEVLILESAFSGVPLNSAADNQPEHPSTGPMSPSVLIKAPSLDEEDLPYENFPSGDPLEASSFPLSETAAAIRIQAAFRGYEVRKSLSREVSPARSTEEEEKVAATEENNATLPEAAEVDQAKEKTAAAAAAPAEPAVPEAAAAAAVAEAAKPTAEDFAQVLSLIPQPVDEELFPVMELSDQDIIEDYEEEEKAPTAATSEVQQVQPATLTDAQVNVAVKEGFGTLASSGKAAAEASTAEKADKAAAAAPSVIPDIEKSIQELEKSFDRDLLADVSSEATAAAAAAVAPSSTPATPTVIEAEKAGSDQQSQPQTLSEEKSPISIEPPTPEITSSQPLFSTEQPSPQLPSKIPILDRANKSILKEPSSPEPHTYTNLSPLLSSPAAADGGNEDSDEESCSTPSPIPLRSSSPSPFSKKRPRRHRKKK